MFTLIFNLLVLFALALPVPPGTPFAGAHVVRPDGFCHTIASTIRDEVRVRAPDFDIVDLGGRRTHALANNNGFAAARCFNKLPDLDVVGEHPARFCLSGWLCSSGVGWHVPGMVCRQVCGRDKAAIGTGDPERMAGGRSDFLNVPGLFVEQEQRER